MGKLLLCAVVVVGCGGRSGPATWPEDDHVGAGSGGETIATEETTSYPFYCYEADGASDCLGDRSECEAVRSGHDFETSACAGANEIWCATFQRDDGVLYDSCVLYEAECYRMQESVPEQLGSPLVEPCFQP